MSNYALTWVWQHSLSTGSERLVLLALADQANDSGQAWPSVPGIARRCRISDRSVQRAIRVLMAMGELQVTPRRNGDRNFPNVYTLLMPPGFEVRTVGEMPPGDELSPPLASPLSPGVVTPLSPEPSVKPLRDSRPEIERLCERLASRVEANGYRRPKINNGWREDCRRLLDLDRRTEEEIARVIDWSTSDAFWHKNMLSMAKLRKHFDRLFVESKAKKKQPPRMDEVPESWIRDPEVNW